MDGKGIGSAGPNSGLMIHADPSQAGQENSEDAARSNPQEGDAAGGAPSAQEHGGAAATIAEQAKDNATAARQVSSFMHAHSALAFVDVRDG